MYYILQFIFLSISLKLMSTITIFNPGDHAVKYFSTQQNSITITYPSSGCTIFDISIKKVDYKMCVIIYNVTEDKLLAGTTVRLTDKYSFSRKVRFYSDINLTFFRGYLLEKPFTSSVSGYIYKNLVTGRIQLDTRMVYIEPLQKFKSLSRRARGTSNQAMIYDASDIDMSFSIKENRYYKAWKKNVPSEENINATLKKNRKSCTLGILADYLYFSEIGKFDTNLTVMSIVHTLLYVNSIFENTDFDDDGIPDNVHFRIKRLSIINTRSRHIKYFHRETVHEMNPDDYLRKFIKYDLLKEKYCLRILFTTQPFSDNILTYSLNTVNMKLTKNKGKHGGICMKNLWNSLIISNYVDYVDYVPQFLTDHFLAHELGHAFGAMHVDEGKCEGYLMDPKINFNDNGKFLSFSKCSKIEILKFINEYGDCMENVKVTSCGNGIMDENEECDCGTSYNCAKHEHCCIPYNGKNEPCRLDRNSGFECLAYEGFCCTKNCIYANLSDYNINCKDEENKCPCKSYGTYCECGHNGVCIVDECHSKECVYSGLLECPCPKNDNKYCEICCLTPDNQCLPLTDITEVYINNSNTILANLQNVKYLPYENITHKVWQNDDICVTSGKLGFCHSGTCNLKMPKLLIKKLEEVRKVKAKKKKVFKKTSYRKHHINIPHRPRNSENSSREVENVAKMLSTCNLNILIYFYLMCFVSGMWKFFI